MMVPELGEVVKSMGEEADCMAEEWDSTWDDLGFPGIVVFLSLGSIYDEGDKC